MNVLHSTKMKSKRLACENSSHVKMALESSLTEAHSDKLSITNRNRNEKPPTARCVQVDGELQVEDTHTHTHTTDKRHDSISLYKVRTHAKYLNRDRLHQIVEDALNRFFHVIVFPWSVK